ncbi:alpha/beta fold hydrolase [Variovorax sp. RHLX14]|uniref:alpha/beta fold hydrolase n=1 Tax=Variovorax sp. RHLX14 TaxID=1259731 RepID=UPI003F47C38F
MTQPSLFFVPCKDAQDGHRMAYWQWGDPLSAHVVVCVHGLTRQGRDFDVLAQTIVARAGGDVRVICPDIVGRGRSDWLTHADGYQVPLYASDIGALMAKLHGEQPIARFDYVGTSMGGLIGLLVAGYKDFPLPTPVHRFVINDVGPALDPAALARIGAYVGVGGRYETLQDAADAMWTLASSFGPHTPEEWLALSRHMVVPASQRSTDGSARILEDVAGDASPDASGPFTPHYDPAIAVPFRSMTPESIAQGEAAMWALYDAITAPTLLVRGADSDLLTPATATAMTQRGPRAQRIDFEGVGHAPTFVAAAQSAAVVSFLFD